jgi:hypothetical protein
MNLFTEDVKITKVEAYAAANTTDLTSDSVDMAADGGYDAVCFVAVYGTAAADNLIHAETSPDDSTFTDITGSEPNDAGASSEIQFVDVISPAARYVRCVAVRGTSTTLENIIAYRYKLRDKPADNKTAGTIEGEQLIAPTSTANGK